MPVSLNDPIWTRLYGPYGVQPIVPSLITLSERWNDDLARFLFWERLYHQGSLYPVTYSAMVVLWGMFPSPRPLPTDFLVFLSLAIDAAIGDTPTTGYQGLSPVVADHAHPWIPENQRLRVKDMATLIQLKTWCDATFPLIAEACVANLPAKDERSAALLLIGYARIKFAGPLARALDLWSSQEEFDEIAFSNPPDAPSIDCAAILSKRIQPTCPTLSDFLRTYARLSSAKSGA